MLQQTYFVVSDDPHHIILDTIQVKWNAWENAGVRIESDTNDV
jgi:hypothetical protein